LAEILGVPIASLTPTASPTPTPSEPSTPIPETTESGDPARTAEETISTSTLSVADYFRQKLREKAIARHAASGVSSELPETSLARVKEEVKVAVGGVSWEGSRMTFGEGQIDEKEDIKPDIKPTLEQMAAADQADVKPSKEERRRAKEEKRRLKEEKKARKAAGSDTPVVKEEVVVKSETMDPLPAKKEKRKRESGTEGRREKKEKSHN
jgi:Pin2-interacting protein X1